MLSRVILPASLLLSIFVQQGEATRRELQTTSSCSDFADISCSLGGRSCELSEGEEKCGPCQPGYIEFIEYSEADEAICVKIDDLTWQLYEENYEPYYGDEEQVDYRISLLKDSAQFSLESNSKTQDFKMSRFKISRCQDFKNSRS